MEKMLFGNVPQEMPVTDLSLKYEDWKILVSGGQKYQGPATSAVDSCGNEILVIIIVYYRCMKCFWRDVYPKARREKARSRTCKGFMVSVLQGRFKIY